MLLSACVTDQAFTDAAPSTEVKVPVVAGGCVKKSEIPAIPQTEMRADQDVGQKAAAAAADVTALDKVVRRQNALLNACVEKE